MQAAHTSPLPLKHATHWVWEVGEVAGVKAEQLVHLTLNSLGMGRAKGLRSTGGKERGMKTLQCVFPDRRNAQL